MSSRSMADPHVLPVCNQDDIVSVRSNVRRLLRAAGYSLVDQTKFVTAVSEIARNAVVYARDGEAEVQLVRVEGREGVQVVIRDQGPGIDDVEKAKRDGFTSGSGLGLGLGGASRLVDEFEIDSSENGTTVRMVRWKR